MLENHGYSLSVRYVFLLFVLCFVTLSCRAKAEENDVIYFGQTAALGGPAQALGIGMNNGILAAFKEFNAQGGLNGKKLEIKAYDDGYEPDRAIENTKKLIKEDNVFAMIGGVGTPTASAIEPIRSEEKVPFIGPFTGAEFLRNPHKRYVVNVRGSYWQETEEWIERLTTDLGIKRIAILYQDDSYGRAGLSGVERALKKRNLELVAEGAYKRNTTAVKSAVLKIRKAKPEAVVMVGAYKPCAEFIRVAKKVGMDPLFVNISFVGSDALAKELGDDGDGVIISQVVPFPFTPEKNKLVAAYQNALASYSPDVDFGFVSLEGYLVGRVVIEILKNVTGGITRETFLDTLYEMKDLMIEDISLHYGDGDNQGLDDVFLTVLERGNTFKHIDKIAQ